MICKTEKILSIPIKTKIQVGLAHLNKSKSQYKSKLNKMKKSSFREGDL